MRDVYSLSLMVNPEKQAAREIERLIKYPGFLQRDTFAKSRVEIVELRLAKDSALCNVVLNDMERIVKRRVLISAVIACFNNIGPGLDVVGPTCNFSDSYSVFRKYMEKKVRDIPSEECYRMTRSVNIFSKNDYYYIQIVWYDSKVFLIT